MEISSPASATGGRLAGAGPTFTVISSISVSPPLSVTVRENTYVPSTKSLAVACGNASSVKVAAAGPETCSQRYVAIGPSVSVPDPSNVTWVVGIEISISAPAIDTGG